MRDGDETFGDLVDDLWALADVEDGVENGLDAG